MACFQSAIFDCKKKERATEKLDEPIRVGLRSKQTAKRAGKYVTSAKRGKKNATGAKHKNWLLRFNWMKTLRKYDWLKHDKGV